MEEILSKREVLFISEIESESFKKLKQEIQTYSVFGIDVEYFSENKDDTIGFVCTIQISTVERDFVVDTLLLRKSIYDMLNEKLFLNNAKIKVFHGCENDIRWLKNDFNIDVVNLFDTMKAQMLIQNQQQAYSLKNLAQDYLKLQMDKSFQLSDWRIRPLPPQMLQYARLDSFVLLKLFTIMKKALLSKHLLNQMQLGCIRILLKKYDKSAYKNIELILL